MANPFNSITLVQLCNFHTLARTLHFTEAARELFITQPTLSASIKSLEVELDVPLLIREGRRNVRLTKFGEELDAELGYILPRLEDVIAHTRSRGYEENAVLRVGTIPTVQYDYLPALLREFWKDAGFDVKVRITVEFSNQLIRGLKAQDYDIIFCANVPEEQGLSFTQVTSKNLVAVVHRKNSWAKRASFSLTALPRTQFATYHFDTPIGNEMHRLLSQFGGPKPAMAFDDEFMLSSAVAANRSLVGIMLDTFEIDPVREEVVILPIDEVEEGWHPICLAYDTRVHQGKGVQRLIEAAQALQRGGGFLAFICDNALPCDHRQDARGRLV